MNKEQYIDIFSELFALNGLGTPEKDLAERFFELGELLSAANKIHNLTAIKEDEDVILKHFIDSLLISAQIPRGAKTVDVGCGAGFPSLPLAIYRPDITLMGIDSTTKKINYVNNTARSLGLTNIEASSARAEDLSHKNEYREGFDVATARAVASLPVLSELCLPFVKLGGLFIAMKSLAAEEELLAARSAIEKCGGEVIDIIECDLKHRRENAENEKRSLIIIKKIKKTPDIYPRIYSKITKKPL